MPERQQQYMQRLNHPENMEGSGRTPPISSLQLNITRNLMILLDFSEIALNSKNKDSVLFKNDTSSGDKPENYVLSYV